MLVDVLKTILKKSMISYCKRKGDEIKQINRIIREWDKAEWRWKYEEIDVDLLFNGISTLSAYSMPNPYF